MILQENLLNRTQEVANDYMRKKWPENQYLDLVHGFPHLERLCGFLTKTVHNLSPAVPTGLIIASVCFHDIGRHLSGDHAQNSADIFSNEGMFENVRAFFYAREVEMIKTAIRLHTRGLMGLDEEEKNGLSELERDLVALTVVYDQLDTLGQDGYARTYCWAVEKKVPLLPSDRNRELIKKILCGEITDIQPYRGIKKEDFTSHLAYNFGATNRIVEPVKSRFSLPLLQLVAEKKSATEKMIRNLIDFSVKEPRLP